MGWLALISAIGCLVCGWAAGQAIGTELEGYGLLQMYVWGILTPVFGMMRIAELRRHKT